MATMNPFDLLGDDDAEDLSQLIAAQQQKVAALSTTAPTATATATAAPKKAQSQAKQVTQSQTRQAKLPSKPIPPALAVKEAKNEFGRGGGRGGGRGYVRGRGGYNRDLSDNENSFSNTGGAAGQGALEGGDARKPSERYSYGGPRSGFRGRRGGFTNGELGDGERPRRAFERRSGTGYGNEFKREGAGRGNWGAQADEITRATDESLNEGEKNLDDEKPVEEEGAGDENKETSTNEAEEKKPEDKEMTLEEYEKVLEQKRKALQGLKAEERKVDAKEFEYMQQLSSKKGSDDMFIKLGSEKDKRKETFDKDEKAKKSVSINEFLRPAEGERNSNPGGRGRGRGRGGSRGFFGNRDAMSNVIAPSIEDHGQFPTLGGGK